MRGKRVVDGKNWCSVHRTSLGYMLESPRPKVMTGRCAPHGEALRNMQGNHLAQGKGHRQCAPDSPDMRPVAFPDQPPILHPVQVYPDIIPWRSNGITYLLPPGSAALRQA